MNWRRGRKLLYRHPYLLDAAYTMPRRAAARLYRRGFPGAEALLSDPGARSPAANAAFDAALSDWQAGLAHAPAGSTPRASVAWFLYRHRAAATACCVLLALVLFFAVLPAGRALAQEIYNFFAEVDYDAGGVDYYAPEKDKDGYSRLSDGTVPPERPWAAQVNALLATLEEPPYGADQAAHAYPSIGAFAEATGLAPFVPPCGWLTNVSAHDVWDWTFGVSVWSEYVDAAGARVYVLQEYMATDRISIGVNGALQKVVILGGTEAYWNHDPGDGTFNLNAALPDGTILMLTAEAGVDADRLLGDLTAAPPPE